MSWSIGYKGTKQQVVDKLREQIHISESSAMRPVPQGMSHEENVIRRQAQTLLLDAVLGHNVSGDSKSSWLKDHVIINAQAHGSECRDTNTGEVTQSVFVSVTVGSE